MSIPSSEWYFVYVIHLPFTTDTLVSQHQRVDFNTSWNEGAELVRKFAERGIEVSLSVHDTRKPMWDHTFTGLEG